MRIWVDDIRTPPSPEWQWCKTSADAILCLEIRAGIGYHKYLTGPIDIMSLDHDLGVLSRGVCKCGEVDKENRWGHADGCRYFADSVYDTTRPVVLWMIENNFWPTDVLIHSANPVGVEWLEGMIERYKP